MNESSRSDGRRRPTHAPGPARGTELLLRHCAPLPPPERPTARERLSALIGPDLVRLLVGEDRGSARG